MSAIAGPTPDMGQNFIVAGQILEAYQCQRYILEGGLRPEYVRIKSFRIYATAKGSTVKLDPGESVACRKGGRLGIGFDFAFFMHAILTCFKKNIKLITAC